MLGQSTILNRWDSTLGTPAYVAVASIVAITPPSFSRDTIETTTFGDAFKTYEGGLADGGELTLELNLFDVHELTGPHKGLIADYKSGKVNDYQIVFGDSTTTPVVASTIWKLSCIVTAFAVTTPMNDRVKASITMKVSGTPNLAFVP